MSKVVMMSKNRLVYGEGFIDSICNSFVELGSTIMGLTIIVKVLLSLLQSEAYRGGDQSLSSRNKWVGSWS